MINKIHPIENLKNICFIKNVVTAKNVIIGEYTYYDDEQTFGVNFEKENILFNNEEFGDKLIIGKFCSIANGTKFMMGSANHRMNSISTYPFNIFGGEWAKTAPHLEQLPHKGDTIVGNDVWFGRDCFVLPGVKIGNGAIIGAKSVVSKDVEPYTVVGGNPIKKIKDRFDEKTKLALENLRWWDFTSDILEKILPMLTVSDTEIAIETIVEYKFGKQL